VLIFFRAAYTAAVIPAGPAPTMIRSYIFLDICRVQLRPSFSLSRASSKPMTNSPSISIAGTLIWPDLLIMSFRASLSAAMSMSVKGMLLASRKLLAILQNGHFGVE
jgi:hypothetical protein